MIRLFIALDPPLLIKQQLITLNRSIAGARWQHVEQMHITLTFIGDVDNSLLAEIKHTLSLIKHDPFELTLQGVDYFGSTRQPRILFAKVAPNPELKKIRKKINNALSDLDINLEKKKFNPHITLARLQQSSYQSVAPFIQQEALYKSNSFYVQEFHIFSSKLHPKGSQYFIEESFSLS